MIKKYFTSSLGYGISGIDRAITDGDLCDKMSDDFTKEGETLFQLKVGNYTDTGNNVEHDIVAIEWTLYSNIAANKAGFICEKEGMHVIN